MVASIDFVYGCFILLTFLKVDVRKSVMIKLNLDVYTSKEEKICSLPIDHSNATIGDLKQQISREIKVPANRLAVRLEAGGKNLYEDMPLTILGNCVNKVYIKHLGPQIDCKVSFLLEYTGPLLIYSAFFFWPDYFYDIELLKKPAKDRKYTVLPFILWSAHFVKRVLETLYIYEFSHRTVSLQKVLKHCAYYWGFASLIAYHVNHPQYTPVHFESRFIGTLLFILCELGNYSTNSLLRNLCSPEAKARRIPLPNGNIFTNLFNLVSCPNYTYEFGAWLGFSLVVNCFYVTLFMFIGFYQMTVWAIEKHRGYLAGFPDYPKTRRIIIPFLV